MGQQRCEWVTNDPLSIRYHDEEWGNLDHFRNDIYLFEMLTLEGAQAGLSWMTILKKRDNYRKAFCGFDIEKVAAFTEADVEQLKQNEGIIRNQRKIKSTITNARAVLEMQRIYGSFHAYLWDFMDGEPIVNQWTTYKEVPASTPLSKDLSKALKKQGFSFVGPVICYSFLQATGLIQDHTTNCFLVTEGRESP